MYTIINSNSYCTYYRCWKFSFKKCKNEINTLGTNNQHEIEKLIKQREIDIESLKEKHKLDIDTKEKEHQVLREEKELFNSVGDATKDLVSDIFSSSQFKGKLNKKIKEGFNKNKGDKIK